MKVKSWNCTGLGPKLKLRFVREWLKDADLVCLQETLVDTSAVQFPGFSHFIRPATYSSGGKRRLPKGGLISLVSSQLLSAFSVTRVSDLEFDGLECLCLYFERLDASRSDLPASFLFFNFYVITQPAPFDYNAFFFALDAYCRAFDAPVVIGGDFNAHLKCRGTSVPNARDRDFREFAVRMEDSGFEFFPSGRDLERPTFLSGQGCTVIDYWFVRGWPVRGLACRILHLSGTGPWNSILCGHPLLAHLFVNVRRTGGISAIPRLLTFLIFLR